MSINAISISSRLEAAGLAKKAADAVASEIVDSNDERNATKADIARLEGRIDKLEVKIDTKFNLVLGLVSAFFIAYIVDKLIG